MSQQNQPEKGTIETLLGSIARCQEVGKALVDPRHPCYQVVCVQKKSSLRHFQLPEPWNGHIDRAPLLFISSNPGYAPLECVPTGDESVWPDNLVADFYINRFSDGQREWIRNGNRALQADGTYTSGKDGQNYFWPRTRAIAADLLGKQIAVPGQDYAITEVVHCKSENAEGVFSAGRLCTSLHLDRVLDASPAKVLVVFGAKAKPIFQDKYPETRERANLVEKKESTELITPLQIAGKKRCVIFHQHPAGGQRFLSDYLTPESLEMVRTLLNH